MSAPAMSMPCRVEFGGEVLWLLPECGVWWPATDTLFVADLHLGKAASFRALGQPVPSGTTQDNLERLTQLVTRHDARRLVFLGDMLHAAPAQRESVMAPLRRWRTQHAALDCVLVRGNHDRHAGDPPSDLGIAVVDEPWSPMPGSTLVACHHPQQAPGRMVLAGHWHPTVTLYGSAHDRQRLPCFCRSAGMLVLPAFGAFTGGSSQPLPRGARLYAVGAGQVWALA